MLHMINISIFLLSSEWKQAVDNESVGTNGSNMMVRSCKW